MRWQFWELRRRAVEARLAKVDRLKPKIVEALRAFGTTRIWLFGTAADRGNFREGSDIDVAVEGMGSERHTAALRALESLNRDFAFDLALWEECSEWLKDRILSRGELLYGHQEQPHAAEGPPR